MKKKKKKNRNSSKKSLLQEKKSSRFSLPRTTKKQILGVVTLVLAIIIALSFFEKAGIAGKAIMQALTFLIGKAAFAMPLILVLAGLAFFTTRYQKFLGGVLLGIILLALGASGVLSTLNGQDVAVLKAGGWLGHLITLPLLKLFGLWVTQIILGGIIVIGCLIFWYLLKQPKSEVKEVKEEKRPSLIKKIFTPHFKVKEIEPKITTPIKLEPEVEDEAPMLELKTKAVPKKTPFIQYQPPLLDLLSADQEKPTAGDTRINSAVIKKTLENFGIPVEMSEVNIGPTVTQYALKPAEGIKLSKITTLSNDLSLALAAHPIRIEAPIPGKSLVGIEVPNRARAKVRLKDLVADYQFQHALSSLVICLGRNVSGKPIYADIGRMPHLLVAGSTGTGKTSGADTFIFTERGMLTFEELCPLPLNSETDFKLKLVTRDGIEETAKNYNNGICQFYKLTTRRGYQIEATAEHPLWVMNEDGSSGWKAASSIRKSDYVAISRGPALFGNKTDISDFKPSRIKGSTKKISFPSKMTPQLAQFLGFLTADGGLSIGKKRKIHRVIYTQANPHLLTFYKKALKELFGIIQFIEKRSGSNPKNKARDIVVYSKHLKEFLAYLGMNSSKSPQKEMPKAVREASKEAVAAFLRAIFENDGYFGRGTIEFSISSKKLSSQVHLMLLNFGIVSSLSIKKVKNYAQNQYYRLSIFGQDARKFIEEVGFIRKEKYIKAKQFLRLSPNPNVDLIPNISSLLKRMGQKYLNSFAHLTNRGWIYQSGILVPKHAFSSLKSYNSGDRMPGYQSLERILDFYQSVSQEPEYQELDYNPPTASSHSLSRMGPSKISKRNFYWDKIEEIERTSGVGYDFFVPGSDSFIGNGFVNHNTIFLNSLILSLLYRNGPATLRLILVDPKRVEFTVYQGLPHLLCPVIFDPQRTINTLKWLVSEMERRFNTLSEEKFRDINGYNEAALRSGEEPMPYIVLIVDELADLMAARGREMEAGIVRLAQMARAVGIHLVLATQRPSVEVITGLIKANVTSRVTFQVASQVDSRTVLDMAGAEKLLGLGDLLFISAEYVKPRRIQGAFASDKEVKKVVDYIKSEALKTSEAEAKTEEGVLENHLAEDLEKSLEGEEAGLESFYGAGEDPLYEEAKRVVIEARKASASLLQRRLRLGYARAARLIDMLEERGVVGPGEGAKPREILMKSEGEGSSVDDDWAKV